MSNKILRYVFAGVVGSIFAAAPVTAERDLLASAYDDGTIDFSTSSVNSEEGLVGISTITEEQTVYETTDDQAGETTETEEEELLIHVSLGTEELLQYPELPTGCESVSLTILLRYYGYDLEKTTIVDEYLPYSAETFVDGFNGDPYLEEGGGCYAPGIAIAANRYLETHGSYLTARDITGSTKDEIYQLLADGKPVLIWSTMYLADSIPSGLFAYFDGKEYEWDYNEHCVVLSGYDLGMNTVEVSDPLEGKITRDADRFWALYEDLGSMAVVIE